MRQEEALTILKTGANVFLTGEPGSGKTHTVNAYVAYLRERGIEPAITASTGIAATHIGGRTIHSWSGIGIKRHITPHDLELLLKREKTALRIKNTHVLIIDEVSMLDAATIASVDEILRALRKDTMRPFGGLQVVFVGDFFQLPPTDRRDNEAPRLLENEQTSSFAFTSPAWHAAAPRVCYLSEQHRQEDTAFLDLLAAIRRGTAGERERAVLRTRYAKTAQDAPHLYTHNANVDTENVARLATLPGKEKTFEMASKGPSKLVETLKRGCLSPETLRLKVNARVMFTKNDLITGKYVNGTLGTVIGFSKESGIPVVRTSDDKTVFAEPEEWRIEEGGQILARIMQIPLRLAWAMTIHKSQGMSLDAAHMDLSNTFEYGQGYVALSRVRALAGLSLAGLNSRALEVHPDVRAKDDEFRTASDAARQMFQEMSKQAIRQQHDQFVRACGGQKARARTHSSAHDTTSQKTTTSRGPARWKQTFDLIAGGMTLEAAAQERGLTVNTIMKHLEELAERDALDRSKLTHLARGNEGDIEHARTALENAPTTHLKPIFKQLGGTIPYETIRLARLLHEFPIPSPQPKE